ncbi:MAG: hypothetical protein H0W09_05375 [Solirubrobacterales bacterium]|nr:hypothetical protein [Solirubrobacterales bacterium]
MEVAAHLKLASSKGVHPGAQVDGDPLPDCMRSLEQGVGLARAGLEPSSVARDDGIATTVFAAQLEPDSCLGIQRLDRARPVALDQRFEDRRRRSVIPASP